MENRIVALAVTGLALGMSSAHAQSCADVLTSDTTLTADLTCDGAGLTLGANDVTLDCAGFTLFGDGSAVGILAQGVTGVTITDCTVDGFAVGFQLTQTFNATLMNNFAVRNTGGGSAGFVLIDSAANTLSANRSGRNAGRGFQLRASPSNLLVDNVATNNLFRGFGLAETSVLNVLVGNVATDNGSAGFVLSGGSTANLLVGNVAARSDAEGFEVVSSGNRLRLNRATGNGTWGFDENGEVIANRYEDNVCEGNASGGSAPVPGTLCSPQP